VSEPTIALAFTPDWWVEELHRHVSDHGGARVRAVVVEPRVVLEESFDVLVVGHRWPPLTRALVADVHARGHAILGVFDREEPASRAYLIELGVDAVVESDAGCELQVRAIVGVSGHAREPGVVPAAAVPRREGRVVAVGGAPGRGRTEVAVHLALACARAASVALVDADDVAPAIAQRCHLPIEPNLRTAIDAVEHGRGELLACTVPLGRGVRVIAGVPNAGAWAHVRPAEVVRVVEALAGCHDLVVADGASPLEDVRVASRGRYATARAIVSEADVLVAVSDGAPHGVSRLLAWAVEARALAPEAPLVVVVNRAPRERFRRAELYEEIRTSLPVAEIAFCAYDARLDDAVWDGTVAVGGMFARGIERVAAAVSETSAS
jgi:MinD-like ATPase involved in chromosome partitioning or flagellar assembly